ncbi:MAG: HAMP domain-containing protein, partial [Dehalococcoidia bacterium]|nr:HAMP domain-containing protein [Dehalococcoidia bacterium]
MRFWHRLPLRGRILSLIFLGMVLILGVFSYFGIIAINETTRRVLAERLVLTRQMAASLDVFLTQDIERVTAASRQVSSTSGEANPPPDRLLLRRIYDASLLPAHYVSLLDMEGNVVMTEPLLAAAENTNRRALPHVQSALSTLKPGLSNITYDAAVQSEVVYLVVPLGPAGQPATGLVELAIDLSKPDLARFLQPADMGVTGRAEIVDGTGRVLATSQAESFLKVSDHGGVLASLIKERRTTVSTCHRCHESASGVTRDKDIITFAPLSSQAPWGIVLRQREAEALAPTRQLQTQWALLALLSLIATVLLGWITTGSVIRPVKDLTAATRRIASGDLSVPVPVSGEDEIGQLARDFDTMRARLKESLDQMQQRARELESLNSIAGIMNQSMELDTILKGVLEQVMKLVNGEMGGILILDEDSQTLSYRVHQGFSDRFVEGIADLKV